jgi:hypothetical protein
MRLFDMTLAERRAYVASLLSLDPSEPDSWPVPAIDLMLKHAEREALNVIGYHVHKLARRAS